MNQFSLCISIFRNIWNADKDSVSSSESNPEDHIYEEIDSDYFDEKETEDNFLLSISLERQRNLKFYGSAGWDFGSVSQHAMETVQSGLLYIDRNSVLVIYKINLTEALSPNLTFAIQIYTANI